MRAAEEEEAAAAAEAAASAAAGEEDDELGDGDEGEEEEEDDDEDDIAVAARALEAGRLLSSAGTGMSLLKYGELASTFVDLSVRGTVQLLSKGGETWLALRNFRLPNPDRAELFFFLSPTRYKGDPARNASFIHASERVLLRDGLDGRVRGSRLRGDYSQKLSRSFGRAAAFESIVLAKPASMRPRTVNPIVYAFANLVTPARDAIAAAAAVRRTLARLEEQAARAAKRQAGKPFTYASARRAAKAGWRSLNKTDRDRIDLLTFTQMLRFLNIHLFDHQTREVFRAVDFRKRGQLERDDVVTALLMIDRMRYGDEQLTDAAHVFEVFDDDGSGKLDLVEYMAAMRYMGVRKSDKKLRAAFSEHDRDGTGKVDADQFEFSWLQIANLRTALKKRGAKPTRNRATNLRRLMDLLEAESEKRSAKVTRVYKETLAMQLEARRKRDLKRYERKKARQREQFLIRRERGVQERRARLVRDEEERDAAAAAAEEAALKARLEAELERRAEAERLAEMEERRREVEEELLERARDKADQLILTKASLEAVPLSVYRGPDAQAQLALLVYINLSHNALTALPATGLFFWASSLRKLDLSFNKLVELPDEVEDAGALQLCDISHNLLARLPAALCRLPQLAVLNVANNELEALPLELGQLTSLEALVAFNNKLVELPPTVGGLIRLRRCELSLNALSSLPESLGGCTALQTLDVSWNALAALPETIGDCVRLETLDLQYNRLKALPASISSLDALRSCYLGRNLLLAVPATLRGMPSLLELKLERNQIRVMPDGVADLEALQSLDLSHNLLRAMPPQLGRITSLHALSLAGNSISALPPELAALACLAELDLSRNQLSGTLLPELGFLTSLSALRLADNQLDELPVSVGALTQLEAMDLSRNALVDVPSSFVFLDGMRTLLLPLNKLRAVPEPLCHLALLEHLDLAGNLIEVIPADIERLTALRVLDLYHNRLDSLPLSLAKLLPGLRELKLQRNPLKQLSTIMLPAWQVDARKGASDAQLAAWLRIVSAFYDAAKAAWDARDERTEHGLAAFVAAVRRRMGDDAWDELYRTPLAQLYLYTVQHGRMPTFGAVGPGEALLARQTHASHAAKLDAKVADARELHEVRLERDADLYYTDPWLLRRRIQAQYRRRKELAAADAAYWNDRVRERMPRQLLLERRTARAKLAGALEAAGMAERAAAVRAGPRRKPKRKRLLPRMTRATELRAAASRSKRLAEGGRSAVDGM
eukprot:PLAT3346.9.p1 GENE.PLAT3346.9~~PLAT3346.9.p1  ORF type:complete len:1287 (+),score=649.53 PLAT3346.9:150-3863(+)